MGRKISSLASSPRDWAAALVPAWSLDRGSAAAVVLEKRFCCRWPEHFTRREGRGAHQWQDFKTMLKCRAHTPGWSLHHLPTGFYLPGALQGGKKGCHEGNARTRGSEMFSATLCWCRRLLAAPRRRGVFSKGKKRPSKYNISKCSNEMACSTGDSKHYPEYLDLDLKPSGH